MVLTSAMPPNLSGYEKPSYPRTLGITEGSHYKDERHTIVWVNVSQRIGFGVTQNPTPGVVASYLTPA